MFLATAMPPTTSSSRRGSTRFTPFRSGPSASSRARLEDHKPAKNPALDFWAEQQASNGEAFFPASIAMPTAPCAQRPSRTATPPTDYPEGGAIRLSPALTHLSAGSSSRHRFSRSPSSHASVYSNDDEDYSPTESQGEDDASDDADDIQSRRKDKPSSCGEIGRARRPWTREEEDLLTRVFKKLGPDSKWERASSKWKQLEVDYNRISKGPARSLQALKHRLSTIRHRMEMEKAQAKTLTSSSRPLLSPSAVSSRSSSPDVAAPTSNIWRPEELEVVRNSLLQRPRRGKLPPYRELWQDWLAAFPHGTRTFEGVQRKCKELSQQQAQGSLNQSQRENATATHDQSASPYPPSISTANSFTLATRVSQAQDEAADRSMSPINEEHEPATGAGASSEPFGHHDEALSMELEEEAPVAASTASSSQERASSSFHNTHPQHEPQSQPQPRRHQSRPQPQAAPAAARQTVVDVDVVHQENGVRIKSDSGGYEVKIFAPLHVKIITAQEAAAATSTTTSSFGQASEPAFHFIVSETTGAIRARRLPADTEMSVATTVVGQGAEAVMCIDRIWAGPCGYKAVFRSSV